MAYKRSAEGEARRIAALRSPEVRARISAGLKGKMPKNFDSIRPLAWEASRGGHSWNAGLAGYKAADKHWAWGKKRPEVAGDKHWNWKGGVTDPNKYQRRIAKYAIWRTAVFERDQYTCQGCGCTKSGSFHAHHIKHFAKFPELRFDVSNGVTLCKRCHEIEHSIVERPQHTSQKEIIV